ncbi:MAG: iron-sulfur cluster-binding protein [Desulfomonile tiedjei]|uniref:Iron-sulfur cluster-binding protein n=1 Tax=Desulfomonile tiedjei TaxID=2358 RepID=A0A9D6Z2C4_9BACT|nr:iron-sulfur cluster-binding protein [Desulfomonile tiedjei]
MTSTATSIPFRANAAEALSNSPLRAAMRNATETFAKKRTEATASLPIEEWRTQASDTRLRVLENLGEYVDRFSANAVRAGAKVYRADNAESAVSIVGSILKDRAVQKVVKSKSMVTEEIHLNKYLETLGFKIVETDLGEYIIQIAGEGPSHIIVPAIHKDRKQVGRLFSEKLGCEYTEDPAALTKIAKKILRDEFLSAKAAISGANFAVADSGSLVIFTNEGNGRMCTTLPPLHIAVLSIEKMIPSLADLPKFMRLLPRSATGQMLTTYMSVITGTRKAGESTGAEELHIVLVDNGRTKIVAGEYREMLKCIRCGACLNACPVYRLVGGHAYGATYPGPMGIVLTTLLEGMEKAHPLLDATTLCGACGDVCPVKVPLPELLHKLREERVERGFTPYLERQGMVGFGFAAESPQLFSLGQTVARVFWPLAKKIPGLGALERMPIPAQITFGRSI